MPVDHYENFPVASLLLPARLRPAVESIYRFARSADDLADEGIASDEARIAALEEYEAQLRMIEKNEHIVDPLFRSLAGVIDKHRLPMSPFYDLLSAFKQDVLVKRYAGFCDLMDYCRRSANPVGRLMLRLYQADDERNIAQSDAVCTALQLINFWQDVAVDWQKGRIYLPQEDMAAYRVSEVQLAHGCADDAWRALMRFEVARARDLMHSGAPLALRLPGRIGWELRLVVQGGLRILDRIEQTDYDVFHRRPKLGKSDWALLVWRSLAMRNAA